MKLFLILLSLSLPAHALTLAEQAAAIPVGTWFKPATANTAQSVDPGPGNWNGSTGFRAFFEAWSGGAWFKDRGACGSIAFWGGGHADYFGNQIIELDICDPSGPKWKRTTEPYKPAVGESFYPRVPCGEFPNGSPGVPHTYGGLAAAGSMLVTTMAASNIQDQPGAPQYAKCAWAYDFDAGVWRGPWPHSGAQYGSAAYDTKRKLVWFEGDSSFPGVFSSLDPVAGTLTAYNKSTNVLHRTLDGMSGYDPIADRVVAMSFRGGSHYISERDPANPAAQGITAAIVNKPAVIYGAHSMAWSPKRGAWIVWFNVLATASAPVYEVKRSTPGGVLTYTFSPLLDASNTLIPVSQNNGGSYGKAQVVTLPDGAELLIGLVTLADGVVAFKLSGATTTPPPPPPLPPPSEVCIPAELTPAIRFCPVVTDACAQPGVFVCEHFDTLKTGALYPGTAAPVVANGVLNFTIPSLSGANAGGEARWTFPSVGEGKTIAFSYRIKADANAIALNIPGRKHFVLWRGASSCTDLELAMEHEAGSARLLPYTNCGARDFNIPLGQYDFILQYPDFDCTYHGDRTKCAQSIANVWQTYYVEVEVGHFGKPDSRIAMWQRNPGGEWKRFVERTDYKLDGDAGFNQFMLTVYMSHKAATKANPVGAVQFDDLVMATRPMNKALL